MFVPDLLVVGDPSQVSARGIEGTPILVVEILSPSTRTQDRGFKSHRYAELGIAHYWLVDPDPTARTTLSPPPKGNGRVAHPAWSGLTVDLAALWR